MDEAFNRGCDARLAGQPVTACPYDIPQYRHLWKQGWWHVQRHWGRDAKWPVRRLPRIQWLTSPLPTYA